MPYFWGVVQHHVRAIITCDALIARVKFDTINKCRNVNSARGNGSTFQSHHGVASRLIFPLLFVSKKFPADDYDHERGGYPVCHSTVFEPLARATAFHNQSRVLSLFRAA